METCRLNMLRREAIIAQTERSLWGLKGELAPLSGTWMEKP